MKRRVRERETSTKTDRRFATTRRRGTQRDDRMPASPTRTRRQANCAGRTPTHPRCTYRARVRGRPTRRVTLLVRDCRSDRDRRTFIRCVGEPVLDRELALARVAQVGAQDWPANGIAPSPAVAELGQPSTGHTYNCWPLDRLRLPALFRGLRRRSGYRGRPVASEPSPVVNWPSPLALGGGLMPVA